MVGLEAILQTIATVAAAVAAWMAFRAVSEERKRAREERESSRPYLSFERGEVRPRNAPRAPGQPAPAQPVPGVAEFHGNFINHGRRPASNLRTKVIICVYAPNGPVLSDFDKTMADDFPHGADWHVLFGTYTVTPKSPNAPQCYVVMCVRYDDQLTSKNYAQVFYNVWPGITNGVVSSDIRAASDEERDAFLEVRRDLVREFLL